MGVFFEQRGLTPMHGRVFAYLLLAEPPYKDFYDIQAFLKASKSAISNALKFLMDKRLVKYITFSGDRRRYFQVDIDAWLNLNRQELHQVTAITEILADVLDIQAAQRQPEFRQKLEKVHNFYLELGEVLDQFVEKWEQK